MMILRARWMGELPLANHYLMSAGRKTRYAYKILAVEHLRDLPHHLPGLTRLKLAVERIRAVDVPTTGAVIHPWRWDPRKAGFNHPRTP